MVYFFQIFFKYFSKIKAKIFDDQDFTFLYQYQSSFLLCNKKTRCVCAVTLKLSAMR
jgi:hypothetical protein